MLLLLAFTAAQDSDTSLVSQQQFIQYLEAGPGGGAGGEGVARRTGEVLGLQHGVGSSCVVKGSYCQCHYCKVGR